MKQNSYICRTLIKEIVMDLATRKYNFIQRLFEVDENLFNKLELVLETKKSSKPISLKQYNVELNQANLRIENGDFYTGEEAEKMASKW
jgi:hypothetical protein